RLLILDKGINNVRPILEHLMIHIPLATREPSPVCQNHDGKLFSMVEVLQRLRSLERRVGIPHSSSLRRNHLDRVRISWIGGSDVLDGSSLDSDDTHRDTGETSTTHDNS